MVIAVCGQHLSVLCPFLDKNLFIFFSFEDTQCDCLFANKMDLEIIDFMCSCNKPGWLVLFLVNYPGLAAPMPPIIPTKSLLSYCPSNSPEPNPQSGSWIFASDEVLEKREFKGPGSVAMALTKAAAQCGVHTALPPPSDVPRE